MLKPFTFAILKPDIVANPIVLKSMSDAIHRSGLRVTKGRRLKMTEEQAGHLYLEHEGKFFYSRLIRHVCSGPVIAMKLELREHKEKNELNAERSRENSPEKRRGILNWFQANVSLIKPREEEIIGPHCTDAIRRWRNLLGPSKLFANCYKINNQLEDFNFTGFRQYFALSDTRNCGHGSNSVEELRREYALFKELLFEVGDPNLELFDLDQLRIEEEKDASSDFD